VPLLVAVAVKALPSVTLVAATLEVGELLVGHATGSLG
jgi:hypothetical protein